MSPWALWLLAALLDGAPRPAEGLERVVAPADVVVVPAGWLRRGSNDEDIRAALELCARSPAPTRGLACPEDLFAEERPPRHVWVSAFAIDRHEVTYGEWNRCVRRGRCGPSRVPPADGRLVRPTAPVTGVTWDEAQRYCAFAEGRLPTEGEWERAARGDDGRRFPWGSQWNPRLSNHGTDDGRIDRSDGFLYAAPVGSFPDGASPFGVLDLAGNAWEWVDDYYSPELYARPPSAIDPQGPAAGTERVVRGGSWRAPAFAHRTSNRAHLPQGESAPDVGLRCAYDLAAPGPRPRR